MGYFSRHTTLQVLTEIQEGMAVRRTFPEEFGDRIIFMCMFNDIDWTKKGNCDECSSNSEKVKDFAKRFPLGHWSFLGPGEEENGMERTVTNLKDSGTTAADVMVANLEDSGHRVFRASSALDRGFLKEKVGKRTIRSSGDMSNAKLLFHTHTLQNQFSIYGAVSNWCDELTPLILGQSFVGMEKIRCEGE